MAIRAKVKRSAPRNTGRRTVTVSVKTARRNRPAPARVPARVTVMRKITPFAQPKKPGSTGVNSYAKALRFLAQLSDYEHLRIVRYTSQNFDLDRMRTLLRKLGNPHEKFRSVHVAGTKGKGSTCAMISSMLEANGYKVGCYSSPHLNDIRERI